MVKKENDIMTNEQLVARIQVGEDTAANMLQLWEQNQRFIGMIAVKYSGYAEMDDLKQEGYLALCEAVRHYNPDQGVPFINYAAFYIRQGMQRYIENSGNCIRIPVHRQQSARKYKKIVAEYQKRYGASPSDAEIRSLMGIGREELDSIKETVQMRQIQSLSQPMKDSEDVFLEDAVVSGEDLEEEVARKFDHERMSRELWEMVDNLPDQQSGVIRSRYVDGNTLREIGEQQGVSIERVRQTEAKALRALRMPKRCNVFRGYHEVYLSAAPIHHVGVRQFQRTWESEVEREALRWAERELGIRDRD